MQKSILSAAIVAGALAISSGANASDCGDISMADMNWPSATLMANVDKIILEAGYGCEIDMLLGATTLTLA